jgi:hypothetical protein
VNEGIYSPPGGRRGTDGRAGNGNGVRECTATPPGGSTARKVQAGGGLGMALLSSPDDTTMQVPPVWVQWLHKHLEVTHEWCTSWYAMTRAKGVSSRIVGNNVPAPLVRGAVGRAWEYQAGRDSNGEAAHGVVMVRGWARTGRRVPGGRREGYVTPLFRRLVDELRAGENHQYMSVATHDEGDEEVHETATPPGRGAGNARSARRADRTPPRVVADGQVRRRVPGLGGTAEGAKRRAR